MYASLGIENEVETVITIILDKVGVKNFQRKISPVWLLYIIIAFDIDARYVQGFVTVKAIIKSILFEDIPASERAWQVFRTRYQKMTSNIPLEDWL